MSIVTQARRNCSLKEIALASMRPRRQALSIFIRYAEDEEDDSNGVGYPWVR
jgi:hypothetical protein